MQTIWLVVLVALAPFAAGSAGMSDEPTYRVSTVAGSGERGFSGDGGPAGTGTRGFTGVTGDHQPAGRARLNEPGGVAIEPDGSLLIADGVNVRVRRVNREGLIETVAGTGRRGYSGDGGPATAADLSVIDILAVDRHGNVYVADHTNCRIRKLTPERH